jgi:hypothetical protein
MYLGQGYFCLLAFFASSALAENSHPVFTVQTKKPIHESGEQFISLSIDPELLMQHDFSR